MDIRRELSTLDVRSFRGADYDTDRYLVVEKVSDIPSVSKRATQKFDIEGLYLRKLNDSAAK
jgi:hypothetical protein